ncbi:hypothetical protein JCM16161A_18760 [Vulcanisaeta sp. JCM 16161]
MFGVDNEKYGITTRKLVKPGDFVIFYVRSLRTSIVNTPSKCQRVFLGPYRVRSSGILSPNHPAVNEWNSKNKFNVVMEIGKGSDVIGAVDVNELLNDLLFITNKARTGRGGWQDHMQFSIISIREEDYGTIINHLNPRHPCIKQLRELMGNTTPCL